MANKTCHRSSSLVFALGERETVQSSEELRVAVLRLQRYDYDAAATMKYMSTRGAESGLSFEDVLLSGTDGKWE